MQPLLWQSKATIALYRTSLDVVWCRILTTFFLQWETIQFISSDCFDEGDSFSWITGFCGCSLGTSECLLESLWGHFVDNFVKDWPFKKGGNQRYWHFPLCSCMLLILYLLILWWSFEGLLTAGDLERHWPCVDFVLGSFMSNSVQLWAQTDHYNCMYLTF